MTTPVRLGLRENAAQFSLLVALNALVGGMVGLERSVLPLVGQHDFGLRSKTAILAFVLAFADADAFADALVKDTPAPPPEQARIVATNRRGTTSTPA